MAKSQVTGGLTLSRFLSTLDADLAAPVKKAVADGAGQVAAAVRAATAYMGRARPAALSPGTSNTSRVASLM